MDELRQLREDKKRLLKVCKMALEWWDESGCWPNTPPDDIDEGMADEWQLHNMQSDEDWVTAARAVIAKVDKGTP